MNRKRKVAVLQAVKEKAAAHHPVADPVVPHALLKRQAVTIARGCAFNHQ